MAAVSGIPVEDDNGTRWWERKFITWVDFKVGVEANDGHFFAARQHDLATINAGYKRKPDSEIVLESNHQHSDYFIANKSVAIATTRVWLTYTQELEWRIRDLERRYELMIQEQEQGDDSCPEKMHL